MNLFKAVIWTSAVAAIARLWVVGCPEGGFVVVTLGVFIISVVMTGNSLAHSELTRIRILVTLVALAFVGAILWNCDSLFHRQVYFANLLGNTSHAESRFSFPDPSLLFGKFFEALTVAGAFLSSLGFFRNRYDDMFFDGLFLFGVGFFLITWNPTFLFLPLASVAWKVLPRRFFV